MMMTRMARGGSLLLLIALAGCAALAEMDQEQMAQDQQKCAASGFRVRTSAMASCMDTISSQRLEEERASDERYDRERRRKDQRHEERRAREELLDAIDA